MTTLSFPTNPTLNQTYTAGGKNWQWDGTVWVVVRTVAATGESAYEIAVRNGFVGTEAEWLASLGGSTALYTWVAYADDISGSTNFSQTFSGQKFMGLGVNKLASTPTTNPTDYSWVAIGGDSSIQGFLTNETHTVAANSAGDVSSFAGAGGTFMVYQGTTDVTTSATFSVVNEVGVDVSINSSGVYTVNSMSADTGTATLKAIYSGVTINRVYSISKAKAGVGGTANVLSIAATAQAFTFTDGIANPTDQSIVLTASGIDGSVTWSASPTINFSTSGTNGEVATIAVTDFGSNNQVVFTATNDATGMADRVTLFRLNQSSAAGGATQNQQYSSPYNPGVVTKPTAGSGTSAGYDSDAYSAPSISGDFVLKFVPFENAGGGLIVALDDNPNSTSPGTSTADYSYVLGTSSLDLYASGTKVSSSTYAEGDKLEIHRAGSTWSWWQNGTQIYSANGATTNVGIRVTLQAVGAVVSDLQLLQNGVSQSITLTSRGTVTATALPAENSRNEYQGSVKVLIHGVWNTYATRTVHTGPWSSGYTYVVGDIFTYSGITYMVTTAHVSSGTSPDLTKVQVLSSQGPSGVDGVSGFLTNESHLVAAAADGTVSDFSSAGGTFRVFLGDTEVTTSSSFGVLSQTGVTVAINPTTGVYSVSAMSADSGTATFSAQLQDGAIIQKTYSIAKSKPGTDGSNAKLIYVTSDRQTITYDSTGALNPSSQTTTFNATVQNSFATVNWTLKTMSGTLLDPSVYLSSTTGPQVTLTAASFNNARGATEGVIVTGTINDSGTYSDSISVVRVKQGATGSPGQDGFTGVLTNESHTVATASDGTGGDYTTAGGTFKVFKGLVDYTTGQGVVYSLQSATGVTIAIDSTTGVYTVSGMSADQGTAILRANYAGTIVDKTYTIVKARAGTNGQTAKLMVVTSNRQTIAYDNTDTILANQDITLTAAKQNTTATVTWTLKTIQGTTLNPATYLSATTGDSITMTGANFNSAISGTQGVIVTASATDGTTFSDSISIIKVRDGIDGTASLTGYLTNEAHVLAADSAGTVSDFSQAGGNFKLFHGTTDVTSAATYSVASETGVDVSIDTTTGAYTVVSMAADIGYAVFQATWSGVTINKTYSIVKSRAGVDGSSPKLLSVASNSQTVAYDSSGNPTPSGQTITFTATKQNTSATVNWAVKDLNGVVQSPTTTYLSAATGDSVTMTEAQFATARNGTGGVEVSATITDGVTLTDTVSVVRVASGAAGAAGANGIVGLLTNESHTVAADVNGNVSSFSSAGGIFKVFDGATDETGAVAVTYSVQTSSGVTISIDSTGTYTVTAMSAGTGTATLRAVYKGINIDKTYTIAKAIAGVDGQSAKILTISSDRQTITYDGTGAINPSAQTTTFSAQKQNTTGTVNWTIKRSDGTVLTPATYLSATTGDTVTLTATNFDAARSTSSGVMVTGTITDGVTISDTISVMKVQSGADGTGSMIGYLTNEAHIVPTDGQGNNPDFSGATGTFKVFNGLTDVTTSASFDIPTGGAVNCTASINATTGVYSVTAMTAESATVTLRAQYSSTTITKVFSLVTSRAGADGAPAKMISVSSTQQTFSYTSSGTVKPQTTTITALRQNTAQATNWKVYSLDGTLRLGTGGAALSGYFTVGGDTLTLTHTNFDSFLTAFTTSGMTIEGSFTDGSTYSDRISIVKISDGSTGAPGASSKLFAVYSNRQTISYTGAGALNPATQDTVFTASKQNTTATVNWTLTDADGVSKTPVTSYLSAASGDSVTMTAAQFDSARGSSTGVIVTGTLVDGQTYTDQISVTQVKAGTNSVVGILTNEAATVPADQNGNVSGSDLASITGSFKVYQGTSDVSTGNSITYAVNTQTGISAAINSTTGAYTVSALTANVGTVTFSATLPSPLGGGVIYKNLTVAKATAGSPAVNGYLTTSSVTLSATNTGTVSDFTPANGTFTVTYGSTTLSTPNVSFSVVSQTGATASINSTTGAYSVTAMSTDQATIVFRALTGSSYGNVTVDKTLSLSKAKQGGQGPAITITPSATAFTFVDGAATPSSQTITLTATLSNVAGPVSWSTTPNVASGTGTSFSVTSTQFNPSTNQQVVVTASAPSGETQSIVLHRLDKFSSTWLNNINATQTDTAASKAAIAAMDDDGIITKREKKLLRRIIQAIVKEYPLLNAKAQTMGITTELTAYQTAYATLYNYVSLYDATTNPTGTSPALIDLTADTTINPTTFDNNFDGYYNAQATLITAMHLKAASTADWSGVGSVPTELTDGRVSAGLTSTGDLNRNIPTTILTNSNVLRKTGGGLFTGNLAATKGATLGTDTFDTDGTTVLSSTQVKNSSITVDTNGQITNIGTSGVIVDNTKQLWSQVTGTGKPADNATVNNVTYSATTPTSPNNGDIWVDTSVTPNKVRVRVAGAWQVGAANVTDTAQITDGAGLGNKATWSGVTGTGKPADNATVNNVTYSATAPASPSNGDIWVNTTAVPYVTNVRVAGAWQAAGNYTTATSNLTDDAGLGTKATWSGVTGTGKPADNATVNNVTYSSVAPTSPSNGDIWVDTSSTPAQTKVQVSGAWQIAGRVVTDTAHITDGAGLGTKATWANVTGTGKPVDNATANNVTYSATAPSTPVNGDIWVDTSVTPTVTRVRVSGAWQAGATNTSNVDQLSDGTTYGRTLVTRLNAGKPVIDFSETIHLNKSLANIDSSANTKLSGIAAGATANNVTYSSTAPTTPNNGDIWVDTSVTPNATKVYVSNAWQVAANNTTNTNQLTDGAGLGNTAVWTNVSSRPVELTDGRVAAGLNASGGIDFSSAAHTNKSLASIDGTANTKLSSIAAGATANNVTYSATAPSTPGNGDIWVDTSVTPNITRVRVAGAWQAAGNYTTNTNQLTDGAGLGNTAVWTSVSSRPTELTDGRVATAINSSGNVIGTLTTAAKNNSNIMTYSGGGTYTGDLNASANNPRGVWSSSTAYVIGDLVLYSGTLYICVATRSATTTTPLNDGTHWDNYSAQNQDQLGDGTTYARIKASELSSGVHKLTVGTSGVQVGDQRNLPPVTAMNMQYNWTGAITYSASTTSATISVAACTVQIGSATVSYNALSCTVAGSAGTTKTVILYLDDTSYTGGTKTLQSSTTATTAVSNDGRVYVGQVTITYPSTTGTTSTGGGTGGGAYSTCVASDAWVLTWDGLKIASEVRPGDWLRVLTDDCSDTRWERCTFNNAGISYSYKITSVSGIELICSETTPITLRDGSHIFPAQVNGTELPIWRNDKLEWEKCWAEPNGFEMVQHISCSGHVYAAGMNPDGDLIFTHNATAKP